MSNENEIDALLGEEGNKNESNVEVKQESKQEIKQESKQEIKFKPGVGVDVGTSNIVVARQTEDGTFVNRFHRDMLYPLEVSEEAADLLDRSDYLYVKVDNKYYVVGEDALKLVNAIGKGSVVRPMKDGILNPSLKESSDLLFYIIKAVVSDPIVENEPLRFSCPANPVNVDADNSFHKMILQNFFTKLGYDAKPVNEAMCIGYDCNPIMKEDEGEVPLSGICASFGGGMVNVALTYKGLELNSFSVTKSGDDIDEKVSKVTGISSNKIIRIKEKDLDLSKNDMSDRVKAALTIYYDEMINRVIHLISKEFIKRSSEVEGEIEVVVAGGSSMPKGFCDKFEDNLKKSDIPFNIYKVRHSDSPFNSVSQGACIRARSDYKKSQKK